MHAELDLRKCALTPPTPEQAAAVRRAVAVAERELQLPPYRIVWVANAGRVTRGATSYETPVKIYLNNLLSVDEVHEVVLHELQHAADHAFVHGPINHAAYLHLERRAIRFAERHIAEATKEEPMDNRMNPEAAGRAALIAEGRAIAERVERQRRRFNPMERARCDEILTALGGHPMQRAPGTAPLRWHAGCGGAVFNRRCFMCGQWVFP
jgi:hypothetical protein